MWAYDKLHRTVSICRILVVLGALLWTGCADGPSQGDGRSLGTDVETAQTDTTQVDTTLSGRDDQSPADTAAVGLAETTNWTTDAVDVDRSVPEIGVVGGLRSSAHEQFDRLVVEFQGSVVPGYHVGYIDGPIVECGSGHSVDVVGNGVMEIRLQPARGHDDQGRSTVDHDERSYDMPVLREAEITCDFEANFTIVLGLDQRQPFRVMELESPPRLVVDIRTAANE